MPCLGSQRRFVCVPTIGNLARATLQQQVHPLTQQQLPSIVGIEWLTSGSCHSCDCLQYEDRSFRVSTEQPSIHEESIARAIQQRHCFNTNPMAERAALQFHCQREGQHGCHNDAAKGRLKTKLNGPHISAAVATAAATQSPQTALVREHCVNVHWC